MLNQAKITAIIPVSNLDQAISFYEGRLGLNLVRRSDDLPQNREARFDAGSGLLSTYESVGAGQSRATVAGFSVSDIDSVVAGLRESGVVFEDYDLPDLKTENGIATVGPMRIAWLKDPDGNIIAIEESA